MNYIQLSAYFFTVAYLQLQVFGLTKNLRLMPRSCERDGSTATATITARRDLMMNKYKLHKSTNATIEGVDVDVELQMYNIYKLAAATAPPPCSCSKFHLFFFPSLQQHLD